jgi:hypothetical protein
MNCNCTSFYTCFYCKAEEEKRAQRLRALKSEQAVLEAEAAVARLRRERPVIERTVFIDRPAHTHTTRVVHTDSPDPFDVAIGVGGGLLLAKGAMALGEAIFGGGSSTPSRKSSPKKLKGRK